MMLTDPQKAASAAIRYFPAPLIVLGVAAPAITWGTPDFPLMVSWSLLVLVIAATLSAARPSVGRLPSTVSPAGLAAVILAIEAGILLLVIPLFVLVRHSPVDDITEWTYPYLNKRWLIAVYGVGVITILLLPIAFRRLFAEAGRISAPPIETPAGWVPRTIGLMLVVGVAWLVAGPPWNAARHHRSIDFHEQVHLGPLQAISKGHLPFIGAASTQYGPGSQLLTYAFMTRVRDFTVVGYREANLAIHFATALAMGLLAWRLIDTPSAMMVILLGLAFSPISMFTPQLDGTMQGAYGWGNGFRYLGALLVVPALGLSAGRSGWGVSGWRQMALGILWGVFAWVSQENLSSTAAAGGLVLMTLGLTRTISGRSLVASAANLVLGFCGVWIPILVYYGFHGEAGAFVSNYFRVAGAVAMGFSNSWWSESLSSPPYLAFRLTPVVFLSIGVATLWDLRRLEWRSPLEPPQIRLLGFVAVLAASYATVLYRSDGLHLLNTLIALPFVLTLAFRDLPSWTAASLAGRFAIRAAVVAAALFVYPITPIFGDLYATIIKPSLSRFGSQPGPSPTAVDERVAFRRATAYLTDEPAVAPGSVPMRQFLDEITEIRGIVGDRKTFLAGMGSVYTGLVYFLADLNPSPRLFERETMTINRPLAQEALADYRRRAHEIECVLVREMGLDEAKIFLDAHPGARVEQRPLGGAPVFVLLAR